METYRFNGSDRALHFDSDNKLHIGPGNGQVILDPRNGQIVIRPGNGQVVVQPGNGQVVIEGIGQGQLVVNGEVI